METGFDIQGAAGFSLREAVIRISEAACGKKCRVYGLNHLQQIAWSGLLLIWSLAGCQGAAPAIDFKLLEQIPDQYEAEAQRMAADPLAYLEDMQHRAVAIHTYRVDFYKQERLGTLIKKMHAEEHMQVLFRAEPLSIKTTMLDDDSEMTETSYMQGQFDNKLRCQWRKALLPGMKPPLDHYDVNSSVTFGRSQGPITEFGIARLLQQILEFRKNAIRDGFTPQITYRGFARLEKGDVPVHHLEILYPEDFPFHRRKVDLLINAETRLPAGVYLWLRDDQLDAKYLYPKLEPDIPLTDADFLLEAEKRPVEKKSTP